MSRRTRYHGLTQIQSYTSGAALILIYVVSGIYAVGRYSVLQTAYLSMLNGLFGINLCITFLYKEWPLMERQQDFFILSFFLFFSSFLFYLLSYLLSYFFFTVSSFARKKFFICYISRLVIHVSDRVCLHKAWINHLNQILHYIPHRRTFEALIKSQK